MKPASAELRWTEGGVAHAARWRSERDAPAHVAIADDRTTADAALRILRRGDALLWRGDFQNARQMLQALDRRLERQLRASAAAGSATAGELFARQRRAQARRADVLGRLLVPMDADYGIPLRRAPDLREACRNAWGPADADGGAGATPSLVALRELLGLVGALEWRRKGVPVAALDAHIHPHYTVFAPVRSEYVDLVAAAPLEQLPSRALAFDIGTGTGVLAALLAKRGIARVVATDIAPQAVACAGENLRRLGVSDRIELLATDLFPPGRAPLVVCNPPWLPGVPASRLEHAIYDADSAMLRGFLAGLRDHLEPGGEGWLILSDLAERLGLRAPGALREMIANAGLIIAGTLETRPTHRRARAGAERAGDALDAARAAEVTTLWRLAATTQPS